MVYSFRIKANRSPHTHKVQFTSRKYTFLNKMLHIILYNVTGNVSRSHPFLPHAHPVLKAKFLKVSSLSSHYGWQMDEHLQLCHKEGVEREIRENFTTDASATPSTLKVSGVDHFHPSNPSYDIILVICQSTFAAPRVT